MTSTLAAQQQASRTAYDCAAVRAAVYYWTGCESADYLAPHFARGPSASWKARIGVALAGMGAGSLTKLIISRTSPGVDVFLFARQFVPDTMIREALIRNPDTQIVVLGAGLDTSGLRINAERLRAGERQGDFFEVDLPASQVEKQKLAISAAPLLGDHLTTSIRYVRCSFGKDEVGSALGSAGFVSSNPTIWVWSGVIHYLSDSAVRATLGEIRRLSAPGSELFFDFILMEAYESPEKYGFAKIRSRFDSFGEVMSFGFRKGEAHVGSWLAEQGLRFEKAYSHEDMVSLFEKETGTIAPSQGTPWSNLCTASFQ